MRACPKTGQLSILHCELALLRDIALVAGGGVVDGADGFAVGGEFRQAEPAVAFWIAASF